MPHAAWVLQQVQAPFRNSVSTGPLHAQNDRWSRAYKNIAAPSMEHYCHVQVCNNALIMGCGPPEAPRATGACSRDEPHPKFCPPMITGNSVFISPSFTYLRWHVRVSIQIVLHNTCACKRVHVRVRCASTCMRPSAYWTCLGLARLCASCPIECMCFKT